MNLNIDKKDEVVFVYNKDSIVYPQEIVEIKGGWKILIQILLLYTIIWAILYHFANTPNLIYSAFFGYLFGFIILAYRYYNGANNLWSVNIDNNQTGFLTSNMGFNVITKDKLKEKLPTHIGFIMSKKNFDQLIKGKKILAESSDKYFSNLPLKSQWTEASKHMSGTIVREQTLYHLNYIILSLGILLGVKNYKTYKSIFPWMLYVLMFSISQIGTWLWSPKLQDTGFDLTSSMVFNVITKSLGVTVILSILNITSKYIL